MVAIEGQQTIIITPPRCASFALHKRFCKGSWIRDEYKHHRARVPKEYSSWRKLIIVRNPHKRLESMFRYMGGRLSFETFSERLVSGRCKESSFTRSLRDYHNDCPEAQPVRLEHLSASLVRLGLPSDVPVIHASDCKRREYKYTAPVLDWVNQDADTYGYPIGE